MTAHVTSDRPHKLQRLATILAAHDAESIALTRPETLSWFFDGARTSVPYGGPSVFAATVHRDGTAVVTALENEADRLAAEEIGGADILRVPWYADLAAETAGVLRDADVADELRDARAALLPVERARYAALGRDAAQAMTEVLQHVRPDMTEQDLAAELAHAVLTRGADPSVILIAGASRRATQHPLPTAAPIGDRVMAVLTAKRFGLHVSLTRRVRLRGRATAAEISAEEAIREVEADAFAATRPGRELREVLADIAASYDRHGFGSPVRPAWRAHHQGGPTGYLGRDPKVAPDSSARVIAGGAFAWNPWAPNVKIEDTVIIEDDAIEVLSVDPAWPAVDVRGLARPATLDLT